MAPIACGVVSGAMASGKVRVESDRRREAECARWPTGTRTCRPLVSSRTCCRCCSSSPRCSARSSCCRGWWSAQRAVMGRLARTGSRRAPCGATTSATASSRGPPPPSRASRSALCSAGGSPRCTPTRSACRCTSRRYTRDDARRRRRLRRRDGTGGVGSGACRRSHDARRGDAGRARGPRVAVAARTGRAAAVTPPARWRMVLRGLSRNRRRAAFTIVGVAVSLSLVLVFAGLRDTVANVLDRQYGTVDRSDGQLYATPGNSDQLVTAAQHASGRRRGTVPHVEVTLTHGAKRFDTILMGLNPTRRCTASSNPAAATSPCRHGGVLLGRGLGRLLSIPPATRSPSRPRTEPASSNPSPGSSTNPSPRSRTPRSTTSTARSGGRWRRALVSFGPAWPATQSRTASGSSPAQPPTSTTPPSKQRSGTRSRSWTSSSASCCCSRSSWPSPCSTTRCPRTSPSAASSSARSTPPASHAASSAGSSRPRTSSSPTGIPLGLVAGIGLARWFMSNYENLGYRWQLRMQTSTIVLVCLAVFAASLVAQWSTWRGLKRINVATIVRERSL